MKTSYKLLAGLAVGLLMLTATTSALKAQTSPFTITILKPATDEVLVAGSQYTIQWQVQGNTSDLKEFRIWWYNGVTKSYAGSGGSMYLAVVPATQTSYNWTVPSAISKNHYFYIQAKTNDGKSYWSEPRRFTINSFSINIVKPAVGESLVAGSQYTIQWQTQGDTTNLKEYRIYFYNAVKKSFGSLITVPATQTSYNWTVPSDISENHYLYVGGRTNSGDTYWSLYRRVTIIPASSPTVTITSPTNNAQLTAGSQVNITWRVDGGINLIDHYYLYFYDNNIKNYTSSIKISDRNQTSYNWTVPNSVGSGHYLVIAAYPTTGPRVYSPYVYISIVSSTTPTVSCSALPNPANVGQTVTWTATSSNFSGTPTYTWSGAVTGTGNPKTASYTTTGTKTATVTATYGNQTATSTCSVIVSSSINQPPVIDGISGPTQLQVNEQGTWTIRAHDPENGSLSYSVKWGDESLLGTTSLQPTFVQTTTFTHTYTRAGTYTIEFTVKDNQNQTAKTTTTVNVVSSQTTFKVLFPNGGEILEIGKPIEIQWTGEGPKKFTGEPIDMGRRPVKITIYNINYDTEGGPCPEFKIGDWIDVGTYPWTPHLWGQCPPGNGYKIKIYASSGSTGEFDESDAPFSLIASSTTPNHKECQNQRCVTVSGSGTNQCQSDSDCARYSCNRSTWQCYQDATGQYLSLNECKTNCIVGNPIIVVDSPASNAQFIQYTPITVKWSLVRNDTFAPLTDTEGGIVGWYVYVRFPGMSQMALEPDCSGIKARSCIISSNETKEAGTYTIKVGAKLSDDRMLWSNEIPFKITSTSVISTPVITSPKPYENLTAGSTIDITWTVNSTEGINGWIGFFYNNIDKKYEYLGIETLPVAGNNSFRWTVPNKVGSGHFILIGAKGASGATVWSSYQFFNIVAPQTTHKECQNQRCVTVSGSGTNQCQSDSDCATPTVSCSASPNPANVGQTVTWTATASNFSGTPTYTWSGAVTGTGNSISASYETTGTKTATVTATYGNQTATSTCSVNITTTSSGATCTFSKSVYSVGEKIQATVCGSLPWAAVSWVTSLITNGNQVIKCVDQQNTDATGCVTFGRCLDYVSQGAYGYGTFYNYGSVYNKAFNCSFELQSSQTSTPTVSCSASPNPANVGQTVTWTATSSNFSGTPTYTWSGAVTGTGNPKTASYETTGTKTATVTATYGNQTATSTCSVQVNAATHKECQNQKCVSVSGNGTDQCQTDSDCSSGCKVSSSEVFVGEKITLTAQIEGNYYSLLKWYDITNSQRIGTPPPDAILLGSGASLQVQFDTPGIKKIMLCPVWQQFNCYPSSTCQVVVKPRESASVLCGDNTSRCVFVTSQIYYPTFGGVEGGDKICNDLAKASGLPGTYKAWLSGFDSTHKLAINVSDRLEHSTLPYKLVTGEIVANNWQELTTKPLLHAININEKGQKVTPRWVWTGSMPNGARTPATLGAVSPDCSNWNARYACCASCGWNDSTNNDPRGFNPVTGENIMPPSWGGEINARLGCDQQYHLYCFQQGSALGSLSAPLSSVQQSITQQLANLYQMVVQLLQQIQALKGQ